MNPRWLGTYHRNCYGPVVSMSEGRLCSRCGTVLTPLDKLNPARQIFALIDKRADYAGRHKERDRCDSPCLAEKR